MATKATGLNQPYPGDGTRGPWRGYAGAILTCLVALLMAVPLSEVLDIASLVLVFMLAVVLSGAWFGRGPALLAAGLAVLLFNVVFVPPRFSLAVADDRLFFTLAVMLLVGLIVGHLTASLRAQARAAAEGENLVRSLYEISRELGNALSVQQIDEIARRFFQRQLSASVTLWIRHLAAGRVSSEAIPAAMEEVARRIMSNDPAEPVQDAAWQAESGLMVPLRGTMAIRGVMALRRQAGPGWREGERHLVDACAALIGSALERIHYIDVARESAVEIEGERLRNALLSAISHDLRTPLSSLVGLADTLSLTRPALTAQQAEVAQSITHAARRMSAMVNNLLDMARMESGPVQLHREWLPVEELIGSALTAAGDVLARHRVVTDVPEDMPLLQLDPVLMERVLVNLLENAAKYTPAGSTVTLGARATPTELLLLVSDNGPGLPSARPQELLRKFARGSRESATAGVGLGLALSCAIVEAHGGRMQAETRSEGGACFTLAFARSEPPVVPLEPRTEPQDC